MIEVTGLSKRFRNIQALSGASFSAANGAITGLLGHNGAGKTTALRILYGLMKSDDGQARIDGVDVVRQPREAQSRVGVMTDAHGLYPRLTAREHIRYFGRLRGMNIREIDHRADQLLDQLDMGGIADRRADGFSQGERMKVCLCRALVHDPGNLIMDEPTNGMDVMTTRSVRNILENLKQENKTILLSSHIMQEVSVLCDEVIVIADGQVLMQGSLDQLLQLSGEDDLEEAFMALTRSAGRSS